MKDEQDFDYVNGACLSSSLLFVENALRPHLNMHYCNVFFSYPKSWELFFYCFYIKHFHVKHKNYSHQVYI